MRKAAWLIITQKLSPSPDLRDPPGTESLHASRSWCCTPCVGEQLSETQKQLSFCPPPPHQQELHLNKQLHPTPRDGCSLASGPACSALEAAPTLELGQGHPNGCERFALMCTEPGRGGFPLEQPLACFCWRVSVFVHLAGLLPGQLRELLGSLFSIGGVFAFVQI